MTAGQISAHPFSISVEPDDDKVAVIPIGELDLATADELDQAVSDVRRSGFDHVVVDLRGISFLDSSGLRVLLGLRNEAERDEYALSLVRARDDVQRIFALTATSDMFRWREP